MDNSLIVREASNHLAVMLVRKERRMITEDTQTAFLRTFPTIHRALIDNVDRLRDNDAGKGPQ